MRRKWHVLVHGSISNPSQEAKSLPLPGANVLHMAILRWFIVHMDACSPPALLIVEDQWRVYVKNICFLCIIFCMLTKKSVHNVNYLMPLYAQCSLLIIIPHCSMTDIVWPHYILQDRMWWPHWDWCLITTFFLKKNKFRKCVFTKSRRYVCQCSSGLILHIFPISYKQQSTGKWLFGDLLFICSNFNTVWSQLDIIIFDNKHTC